MFGFGKQPPRIVKKSIDQSIERQERIAAQSNNYDDDDGMPYESILDNPEHKKQVAAKAWEKYLFAKQTYETTRDSDHWQYMQKCITEYKNITKS